MQKIVTLRLSYDVPRPRPVPEVQEHLQAELTAGWRVAQVTPIGVAVLPIKGAPVEGVWVGWFVVVLEKSDE
jgi:hypothetical protein